MEALVESRQDIYKHCPLPNEDSLRLLTLYPGNEDDAIRCALDTCSLNAKPSYEALSYAWGEQQFNHSVHIQDWTLPITSNLASALRTLRYDYTTRRLWIDAICINQNDAAEKEDQISLMLQIYRSAQQVVVYLGEEADGSELMYDMIHALAHMYILTKAVACPKQQAIEMISGLDFNTDTSCLHPSHPAWAAARAFFGRPWMRRAWVVQEVIASANCTFVCGRWQLPKAIITNAVYSCIEYPTNDPYHRYPADERTEGLLQLFRILLMSDIYDKHREPKDLIDILPLAYGTKASGRRDHLYAVLGLSLEARVSELRPSYTETWPMTYQRYAEYLISQQHGLFVLYSSSQDYASTYKRHNVLPSWVPDWPFYENRTAGFRVHRETDSNTIQYKAAISLPPSISTADNGVLHVAGKLLGTIVKQGPVWTQSKPFDDLIRSQSFPQGYDEALDNDVTAIKYINLRNHQDFPPLEAEIQQLLSANICKGDLLNGEDFILSTLLCDRRPERKALFLGDTSVPLIDDIELYKKKRSIIRNVGKLWMNNRRCITNIGLVGQVPVYAREGDYIALIMGAAVPFVLRPSATRFTLVGQAYFDGVMQGEGLDPQFGQVETIELI